MKLRIALVLVSCVLSVLTGLVISRGGASAGLATLGKSGVGKPDEKRTRPLIGLSMDTLKEERWQGDRDMFVKRANELGADVQVLEANSDDNRQIKDVEALITRGVNAIVIIPHDGAACAKGVELAHQANLRVLPTIRLIRNGNSIST